MADYSLRKLPEREGEAPAEPTTKSVFGLPRQYDFLAPESALKQYATNVVERWKAGKQPPARTGPEVLLRPDGQVMEDRVEALLRQRDNRPIAISE